MKITCSGDARGEVGFVDMGDARDAAAVIERLQGMQASGPPGAGPAPIGLLLGGPPTRAPYSPPCRSP